MCFADVDKHFCYICIISFCSKKLKYKGTIPFAFIYFWCFTSDSQNLNSWCTSLFVKLVKVYFLNQQSAAATAWHISKLDPGFPGKQPKKQRKCISRYFHLELNDRQRQNSFSHHCTQNFSLPKALSFILPSFHFWTIQSIVPASFNPSTFHPMQ